MSKRPPSPRARVAAALDRRAAALAEHVTQAVAAIGSRLDRIERERLEPVHRRVDGVADRLEDVVARLEQDHDTVDALLVGLASELGDLHRMAALAVGERAPAPSSSDVAPFLDADAAASGFALWALGGLPVGAVVVASGPSGPVLPGTLAALGRQVVTIAPPSTPLEHPAIVRVYAPTQLPARADAGVIAWDLADFEEIAERLMPGAPVAVVLSAERDAEVDAAVRTRVDRWEVVEDRTVRRTGPARWEPVTDGAPDAEALVMLAARRR